MIEIFIKGFYVNYKVYINVREYYGIFKKYLRENFIYLYIIIYYVFVRFKV